MMSKGNAKYVAFVFPNKEVQVSNQIIQCLGTNLEWRVISMIMRREMGEAINTILESQPIHQYLRTLKIRSPLIHTPDGEPVGVSGSQNILAKSI